MGKGAAGQGQPQAAAVYVRISDDRSGEAAGVKRQEEDCRALAAQRGWPVAEVYRDNDISAYTGKERPAYQRLLTDLRDGRVDAVVAWHPDRLHRSPRELEDFIDVIEAAHARVATVKAGDLDFTTAAGRQNARLVGVIARGESERMGERIRRKHEQIAAEGRLSGGGSRPFGYEDDRVTVRASEASLLRTAAQRVLAGESMYSVVREWNAKGIKTTGGKVWDITGFRQVLTSARISGRREHHGQVVAKATWKGIISAADSDRLRSLLGKARGRRPGPPVRSLLRGFLICGRCGIALAGSRAPTAAAERATAPSKNATPAYACSRHPRNRPTACGRIRIRAGGLEELVSEMVFARVDTPAFAARVAARSNGDKHQGALEAVAALETDMARLAKDFGEQRLEYGEWREARAPLERALATARRRLEHENGTAPLNGLAKPGALRAEWNALSVDRKRAILGVVIESITIKPANAALPRNRFDVGRVKVVWKV